jgi:hypothetical protein
LGGSTLDPATAQNRRSRRSVAVPSLNDFTRYQTSESRSSLIESADVPG